MEIQYFYSAIIGYLLGSIPTAYLLLKKTKGLDITKEGTGNVGARNSFDVTSSKTIGISVLIIDLLKGLAAVMLTKLLFGEVFLYGMIALIFAVFSHCYSPWLKFKGGRGLATGAGGSLVLAPSILIIWLIIWVIAYIFRKNTHFGNIAATFLTMAVMLTSFDILNKYSLPPAETDLIFGISSSIMLIIILSRHYQPFKDWLDLQKNKSGDK